MMMGAIELIVILLALIVIPVALGSAALFGSQGAQSNRRSRSRVDWSKVVTVFVGAPLLLLAIPLAIYFLSARQSFQHEQLHSQVMIERDISALETETFAIQKAIELEASHHNGGTARVVQLTENETSPTVSQPSESISSDSISHGNLVSAPVVHRSHWSVGMISIAGLFAVVVGMGFFGLMVWVSRKNGMLALGTVFGILLLLGFVGLTTSRVSSQSAAPPAMIQYDVPAGPAVPMPASSEQSQPSGLIPVGVDEAVEDSEAKPLRTREVVYVGGNKRTINSSDVVPEWVAEANGENILSRQKNHIILTSKRYTTVEEALAELRPLATSMVTDFMTKVYPEMRTSSMDPVYLEHMAILQKSCQVTWPLQVGEFTQEMQQVVWKLDISEEAQQKLHHHWQQQETSDRLAILGGGLGGLTLLFGAGAMLTRRREEKKAA